MNKKPYLGEFSDTVNLGQKIYYTNFDYRVEQSDDLLPSEKIHKNKTYNMGHFIVNDRYGYTKDIYLFAYDGFSGIKNIQYSDRKGGGLFSEHYDISDLTNEKTDSYLMRKSHIFYADE